VLVDGFLEPVRFRVEFLEHPVVKGQAAGNAAGVGGLELRERSSERRGSPDALRQPGEPSGRMGKQRREGVPLFAIRQRLVQLAPRRMVSGQARLRIHHGWIQFQNLA
jgi:hypothetical protein